MGDTYQSRIILDIFYYTVESRKFEVIGTRDFVSNIKKSNYREENIKNIYFQKLLLSAFFPYQTNILCA